MAERAVYRYAQREGRKEGSSAEIRVLLRGTAGSLK
jgi:hypothetical protein